MAKLYTPEPALGTPCPDFDLPSTAGVSVTLSSASRDSAGQPSDAFLVMFICNHCPYVKAIETRLIQLAEMFRDRSVSMVAISSNDTEKYGDDSFEKMKLKKYPFPYLYDESQSVAMDFGAVCTPDFFLYDRELKLKYRGRLDDSWQDETKVTSRDLAGAIESLLQKMHPNRDQKPSMGCSLKWKPGKEPPPARPMPVAGDTVTETTKGSR